MLTWTLSCAIKEESFGRLETFVRLSDVSGPTVPNTLTYLDKWGEILCAVYRLSFESLSSYRGDGTVSEGSCTVRLQLA